MNRRSFLNTTTAATSGLLVAGTADAGATAPDHLATLREVILAWRRKDLEGMLAGIHDDIAWHSHVGSPPIQGKAAMREFAGKLGAQMNDIRWRVFEVAQDGDRLHVEGVDDFVTPEGRRIVVPYAGVLGFRDGKIVEWRDYFDRALFDRLKGGEPLPAYLQPLVDRPGLF